MVNAVSKAFLATPDNVQPVRHRRDFMGQLEQLVPVHAKVYLKENSVFLNLDLVSYWKYVHLLTENSLVKVGVH